jgi:hypothetical protein
MGEIEKSTERGLVDFHQKQLYKNDLLKISRATSLMPSKFGRVIYYL